MNIIQYNQIEDQLFNNNNNNNFKDNKIDLLHRISKINH